MYRKISQALVILLMLDAAWVFWGIASNQNRWLWICGYWFVLTLKNLMDYMARKEEHGDHH